MRIATNIEAHRSTPRVSLDRYVKSRVVELGQSLDGRAAVYLDIKFWIILRGAAAGLTTEESHIELLRMLRKLTTAGQVFCPISESIFMELMKHGDGASRLQTARLIDELSLGVSLIAYDTRVATELAHFIQSHGNDRDSLHPLHDLVWSKLVYVLGFVHPTSLPFDAATGLAVQKAFFDEMWAMSLAAMVAQIGDGMPPGGSDFGELAGNLNEGIARHAAELRSFTQAYDAELRGVVDACGDMIMQIVSDTAERAIGSSPSHGSDEWVKS